MRLRPPEPVLTGDLLPVERDHLLTLLANFSDDQWQRPTGCPGWSVKDIALHLLADDLNVLSRLRDRFSPHALGPDDDLVAFIDRFNATWVEAARRLSPRVLRDLLRWSGEQTHAYYASLDPFALGGPVEWAGSEPAPSWLEIAREYTERWVHQAQIRDAVGAPPLTEPSLFGPVLAAFARALPRTFCHVAAPVTTAVSLIVEGPAGGSWTVRRENDWTLYAGRPTSPAATARMDDDTAWRLFTKGISPADAARRVRLEGDASLGHRLLETVAILA